MVTVMTLTTSVKVQVSVYKYSWTDTTSRGKNDGTYLPYQHQDELQMNDGPLLIKDLLDSFQNIHGGLCICD